MRLPSLTSLILLNVLDFPYFSSKKLNVFSLNFNKTQQDKSQFLSPSIINQTPLSKLEMQQSNRIKIFTKFTQSIALFLSKETMQYLNDQYCVRQFKIWEIDASLAINLYFGIITRNKRSPNDKVELGWFENQLRLFVWTLVFYAHSNKINIEDLLKESGNDSEQGTVYDWEFFFQIFPNKPRDLFIYQAKNLLKKHNQYKKWVHEEDEMFQQLVKRDNYRLKWSDLGKYLFIQSKRKYFRTPKQCRQRWLNHLDPSKLKKYWEDQEDFILIQYVKFYGKKWATISKKLGNKRNEHSIKNRFKSLLTKQSKTQMRPFNEEELIDSIYSKCLQSQKKEAGSNTYQSKSPNIAQVAQISEEDSENSVSIFQEKENEPSMRDFLHKNSSSSGKELAEEFEDKNKVNWANSDRQKFEFSKHNLNEPSQTKQWKKDRAHDSQFQKRIRADLFLQSDPFQMLKSHFYRHAQ